MFTNLIPAASPTAPTPDDRARFLRLLRTATLDGEASADPLQRLILSQHHGEPSDLDRLIVRPLRLRGEPALQLVWRHATRDITKNLAPAEGLALIDSLLDPQDGAGFAHAHLDTRRHEIQFGARRKGGGWKFRLQVGKRKLANDAASDAAPDVAPHAAPNAAPDAAAAAADDDHNRTKHRLLDLAQPAWLDLGLASADARLVPSMARKWKQINRFTEIFADALGRSPLATPARVAAGEPVRVIDFGCGKGYLTFAMHQWLTAQGRRAEVTGVELRQELVTLCEASARRHGHDGLRFDAGDVRHYTPPQLDVMVALHACDIATDHAIDLGLRAGASIIMCSPCCHKELRGQLQPPGPLRALLRHGVHLGLEAEMVTDSLRALLLDAAGYDTQVFEFVSLEHTNKNKMILAVRRERIDPSHADRIRAQIAEIKAFYGIREQCLETLVAARCAA
ncbi:class I SAM-dependent methyltransferase [Leptothrix discophora]|uniref:SAM-dependent methyltransferase n=1 Tax=Leptothrix discophora TaxID=89 RepID=A0ABT9G201_LEPDI|nr:SAM-dependent methyltransferase [Leptothrix discophora]MDP4300511.1 SAM-dependent methyltransferase [Leptothrix discophora]